MKYLEVESVIVFQLGVEPLQPEVWPMKVEGGVDCYDLYRAELNSVPMLVSLVERFDQRCGLHYFVFVFYHFLSLCCFQWSLVVEVCCLFLILWQFYYQLWVILGKKLRLNLLIVTTMN